MLFYFSATSRKSAAWAHTWARARMPGEQTDATHWEIRVRNNGQTNQSGNPAKGKSRAWKHIGARTRSARQQTLEENGPIRNRKEVLFGAFLEGN